MTLFKFFFSKYGFRFIVSSRNPLNPSNIAWWINPKFPSYLGIRASSSLYGQHQPGRVMPTKTLTTPRRLVWRGVKKTGEWRPKHIRQVHEWNRWPQIFFDGLFYQKQNRRLKCPNILLTLSLFYFISWWWEVVMSRDPPRIHSSNIFHRLTAWHDSTLEKSIFTTWGEKTFLGVDLE